MKKLLLLLLLWIGCSYCTKDHITPAERLKSPCDGILANRTPLNVGDFIAIESDFGSTDLLLEKILNCKAIKACRDGNGTVEVLLGEIDWYSLYGLEFSVAEQDDLIARIEDMIDTTPVDCNGMGAQLIEVNAEMIFVMSGVVVVSARYQCCGPRVFDS